MENVNIINFSNETNNNIFEYENKPLKIKSLPIEVLEQILVKLDDQSLKTVTTINKKWNNASIDTAKHRESALIDDFIKFLLTNLNDENHVDLKSKLIEIFYEKKILNSVNLIEVKSSTNQLREEISSLLNDKEILKFLKTLSEKDNKPKLFNEFYSVAWMYNKIDSYVIKPNSPYTNYRFQKVCEVLAKKGYVNKIAEFAKLGEGDESNSKRIVLTFAKYGQINKALEIVGTKSFPFHYIERELILAKVCIRLAKSGNFNDALELACTISDDNNRRRAFDSISVKLAQSGEIDKALELYNKISFNYTKENYRKEHSNYLKDLAIAFMQAGHFDKALGIINTISKEIIKTSALAICCYYERDTEGLANISSKSCTERAHALFNNPKYRKKFKIKHYPIIIEGLLKNNKLESALEFFNAIPNSEKASIITYFCNQLIINRYFDDALTIYNSLDDNLKGHLHNAFINELIECDDFEKAIEITNPLADDEYKTGALEKIKKAEALNQFLNKFSE